MVALARKAEGTFKMTKNTISLLHLPGKCIRTIRLGNKEAASIHK